jgi:mono/diheme cytochrome c family protein
MKRSLVLIVLVALVGVGSYAVFAQYQQPSQPYEQSMGGMMGGGGGMMGGGSSMMGRGQSAWEAPSAAAGRRNPVPADPASVAAGKALFDRDCAPCHGVNGKGNAVGPDLTSPAAQNQTDGALFWKMAQGKPPMPSFANTLTAHQGWDIVNYVRTLAAAPKSGGAPAGGAADGETTATVPPGTGRGMMGSGMMQGGMGQGMMGGGMGRGMMGGGMGRGVMMPQGAGPMGGIGCPGCGVACGALAHVSATATADGGVVVAVGGKLIRYDSALKKVSETDLDVDWTQVHRKIQQIMQNCPLTQHDEKE